MWMFSVGCFFIRLAWLCHLWSIQGCLVHTTETIQVQYFMERLLEQSRPVMLVGSAGTGKSVLVNNKLESLDPEKYMINNVPFNYYTTAANLQGTRWSQACLRSHLWTEVDLEEISLHHFSAFVTTENQWLSSGINVETGLSCSLEKTLLCSKLCYLSCKAVLEKPLEKKGGRIYGPPDRRRMVCFIDDLNMPEVDTYGTVQPHTLIRQHMDYKHW